MVAVRFVLVLVALAGVAACDGPSTPATGPKEGCSSEADAVFWGGTQWVELAEGLAGDASECIAYFITVPPVDNDRTALRGPGAFEEIRALSASIHPVAEIRYTGPTGWREWAAEEEQTSYEAGVEARRRMDEAGLNIENGETWAFNELSPEVLANEPGWREDVLEFMRGLYDGGPGMGKAPGIVFNVFVPSDTTDLAAYKASLKKWLEDEAFWVELDKYVELFAEEVYANPANWGVAGASLEQRTGHLQDYLFHLLTLANAAPGSAGSAQEFLQRAFVPLANAAWPHEGIGKTNVLSAEAMAAFVAAQVHAIRSPKYTATIGFAWAPNEAEPSYSEQGRDVVLAGLAAALRAAYEEDGDPCAEDACAAEVEGGSFNEEWARFSSWD